MCVVCSFLVFCCIFVLTESDSIWHEGHLNKESTFLSFFFNPKGRREFTIVQVLKDYQLHKSALIGRLWCYFELSRFGDLPAFSNSIWSLRHRQTSIMLPLEVQRKCPGGCGAFVTTSIDHELLSCAKSPVRLLQKRGLQPPSCFLPIPSRSQGKCSPWLCDPCNRKRRPPEWAGWKINPHKIHISNQQLFSFSL